MYVSVRMWLHVCARMGRICSRQHLFPDIHTNIRKGQVLQNITKQQVVSVAARNVFVLFNIKDLELDNTKW